MAADGASLIAAAVRAACLAKAPRRTVQAVAAAVAGVFAHQPAAAGARTKHVEQPAAQHADDTGVNEVMPEALVEAIRSLRRAQRQRKKERKNAKKAGTADENEAADGRAGPVVGKQKPDTAQPHVGFVQPTEEVLEQEAPAENGNQAPVPRTASRRSSSVASSIRTNESAMKRMYEQFPLNVSGTEQNEATESVTPAETAPIPPPRKKQSRSRTRGGRT